jgi:hypothetical protein
MSFHLGLKSSSSNIIFSKPIREKFGDGNEINESQKSKRKL